MLSRPYAMATLVALWVVALAVLASTAPTAVSQGDDVPVRLQGGTVAAGESTATSLTVDLGQRPWIDGLELTLTYNPDVVRMDALTLAPGWEQAGEDPPPAPPGVIALALEASGQACTGVDGCLVLTIEWTGVSAGDAGLRLSGLRLGGANAGETPPFAAVQPLTVGEDSGDGNLDIGGAAMIVVAFAVLMAIGAFAIALLARLGVTVRGLRRRPDALPLRARPASDPASLDAATTGRVEEYFAVMESLADAEYSESRNEPAATDDDSPATR